MYIHTYIHTHIHVRLKDKLILNKGASLLNKFYVFIFIKVSWTSFNLIFPPNCKLHSAYIIGAVHR